MKSASMEPFLGHQNVTPFPSFPTLYCAVHLLRIPVHAGTGGLHHQGPPIFPCLVVQRAHLCNHRIRSHVGVVVKGGGSWRGRTEAWSGMQEAEPALCRLGLRECSTSSGSRMMTRHTPGCVCSMQRSRPFNTPPLRRAPNPDCISTNLVILAEVLTTCLLQAALLGVVYARFRCGRLCSL